MRSYVGYIAAVSIPITLCAIVLSRPIVDILFVHGAFTAHDARTVSQVQALYLLQIPFYMVAIVGVRTLAALKRNQVLALITGGMVVANLVTDLMFVHLFGIPGIALSTSCVYVCSSTAVFVATAKILRAREQESV